MSTGESAPNYELGPLEELLSAGLLLLTPNQRLARAIKAAWDRRQAAQGLKVWPPARVQALDAWLSQLWEQALYKGSAAPGLRLGQLQELHLWERVISDDCARQGNYSLLQTSGAAELAAQARRTLREARLDPTAAAVAAEFKLDSDCATFLRWLCSFEAELERQGWLTAVDCLQALLDPAVNLDPAPVALVDFGVLSPLHRACLDKFSRSLAPASSLRRQSTVSARSYPDRETELAAVASWAAQQQRERPGSRLGIILQDMHGDRAQLEYALRREFDCLGENYTALPVNFSTAITLDRAPVIRDALIMLSCGERELPLADLLQLFRSRFSGPDFATDRATTALIQRLFDDGREQVASGRLRAHARACSAGEEGPLWRILSSIQAARPQAGSKLPSAWVDTVASFLQLWGWPGNAALDSLEYQQVERWYQVLDEFAAMDPVTGELGFQQALALLRQCCQASVSQPQTPDSPVQVLGPLEAAGLQFDALWLCGLEASKWPERAKPNPFIPVRLQRERELPHATTEQQWQFALTLWQQYQGGCGELTASCARQIDNAPQLPSPLLAGLSIVEYGGGEAIPSHWLAAQHAAEMSELRDPAGKPQDLSGSILAGGVGVLQDQAACPFRAYAARRLGLEPLGQLFSGLSPRDRGTLLHSALQVFWEQVRDSEALCALDRAALDGRIAQAAEAAVGAVSESLRLLVGSHCLELEARRLHTLLGEWLRLEQKRESFSVEAREEAGEYSLGDVSLRLRVDRVDRLADGSRVVIDYKSGNCDPKKWLGERPLEPQLPLYSVATGADAVVFAQVKSRNCKFAGLGAVEGVPGVKNDIADSAGSEDPEFSWRDLNARWQQQLTALLAEFLAGDARVAPQPGACDYCAMRPLCRIDAEQVEA